MILTRDTNHGDYEIRSYEPGLIKINDDKYTASVLLSAHQLEMWSPQTFKELDADNLATILLLKPDIVLLGTGEQLTFPNPKLLTIFSENKIGIEVMTTLSACYTFNVLMSEGRNVVAALLIR